MHTAMFFACLAATMTLTGQGSPTLRAQDAPREAAKAKLPSGESIINRHRDATRDKDKWKTVETIRMAGTMTFVDMGISAPLTQYFARPNLYISEINIPGYGKVMEGFDGQNAWAFQPSLGPELKTGEELEEAKERSLFAEDGSYPKAETMGLEKVEGEECYKVLVTTNSGKTETRHYSKKTGYLVKTILKIMMGDTEAQVEAIYKNYKKIGGLVYPSTLVNNMPGQNKMITYDDVKINVQIPESIFEPPPQVKALLSNKGQEAAVPSLARPDLPSGASIRERYTQAVGGKEAFEKIKTEVRNGTINVGINIPLGSLPDNLPIDLSNGLTFAITDYRSDPNLHLREDWLLGECFQRMGSNGQNAWKWDAVHGYELWPDPAPLPAERNSSNWQDEFKADTVGVQVVEGEECYKVV